MNEEMALKLQQAKSPAEIISIASEYELEISSEKADELFAEIQKQADQELSLKELDEVAGGKNDHLTDALRDAFKPKPA